MSTNEARLVGVELYFEDLSKAKTFYRDTLGIKIEDEGTDHHCKFAAGAGFLCVEKKGVENYPSEDKAVLFFEVANLKSMIAEIGPERLVHVEEKWLVLHDPEGHNVILLQAETTKAK